MNNKKKQKNHKKTDFAVVNALFAPAEEKPGTEDQRNLVFKLLAEIMPVMAALDSEAVMKM